MSDFDALDAMMLDTAATLFGDAATFYPMMANPASRNAAPVMDASRVVLRGVVVIRSRWSERVQPGGQGVPMPAGAYKQAVAGSRHILTVPKTTLATLQWPPAQRDEVVYDDEPDTRYSLGEPLPDGGAGLHFVLNKV